ncbi:MAG TPA: PAS domain S-box protein [Blastocatellia bacterium]|nr:PAS domain S-box protein [Blastocatellia bacterium]
MRILSLTRTARFGVAVLSVAIAAAIRLALNPILGDELPLFIFIFPIILAAWYGGFWPGLLATALSLLLGEYLFITPRGSIFHYENVHDLLRAEMLGTVGAIFSIMFDRIRKSIKAEMESLESFRLLVDGVKDYAIFMLDPQGRVVSWNSGAERINGYTEEEIIGRDFLVFRMPEEIETGNPRQVLEIAASNEVYEEEGWRVRKDGSRYVASEVITALRDDRGRLRGFAKVMRDITERKLANDALRESQQFVSRIIEVSPSLIYIYDVDRRNNVFFNRDIAAALGYDPGQYEQKAEFVQSLTHPDDLPKFLAYLNRIAGLRDDETAEFEYRMRHASGDWHWLYSRDKVFARNEDGGVREIIGTATDITERKQAEVTTQFINTLNKALRPIADPEEIMAIAARILGEHLDVDRCAYAEIELNEEYLYITCDYTRGEAPSAVGRFTVDDLGAQALRLMRENRPYMVTDIEVVASAERDLTTYQLGEVRALMCVPIYKNGHYVARMAVSQKTPRRWLREEVEIVTIVANRCWESVQRSRAIRNLRDSEECFAKAFHVSPDGLLISRISDGVILEVNDGFVSLSGYERDEAIGKSVIDLGLYADPTDRQRALSIMNKTNRVRDLELTLRRKSGEARLVTMSADPLELRGERCWLWIGRDITERKQAEEALRRSEEQARRQLSYIKAIYDTAPVGLCFLDTDLRYVSINECLAEINGEPVAEHLGRTPRQVLPNVADRIEPILRRVIETGAPVLDIEVSADTSARAGTSAHPRVASHFLVSYYPIKDDDGRVLGVNTVVVDITQRKEIEEERERLFRQEKAARKEAEAASRMKDEFLATISHELRTPLTSILGWARLLSRGPLPLDQTRHAAEVIAKSAQSQTRLIDDILDTSRIITGRLKLDAHPVEIERVFQTAVGVVRSSAEVKGVALQAVIDAQGGVVFGDGSRLQQAIWNLLSNAVKFTNAGGRVEARLKRVGNQIDITVSDTGIGIEPQFLPHVFELFRQADSTDTRRYGGLGLGLSIVRHIVEMHGGGVTALSPGIGRGATFKIWLPLASTSRPPKLESGRLESEAPQTKWIKGAEEFQRLDGVRILLVEDDPESLDLLKFVFDECGAEVITADSANEALEKLERLRPNALISDIAMPDQDGYDLIRRVRSRDPERGGEIPAVAVTAYASAEDRVRALAAGFQMHVAKPINLEELIAVVANLTR